MIMETSECTVEYLLIIDSENNFCSNKDSFNNLITTYTDMKFNENKDKITYDDELVILYKSHLHPLNTEKNSTKNVFNIHFTCENLKEIEKFREFIKKINGLLCKISEKGGPYLLRDDINLYYSEKAYSRIHEIENLMRKLINKFMILNVGTEWTKHYLPNGTAKQNNTTEYLYSLNIDQLSSILFDEYSPNKVDDLLGDIRRAKKLNEFSLDDLKKYVKQSNWDRIFKDKVSFSGDYLKSRWKVICENRNIIAHNKPITIDKYNNLLKNIEETKEKLNEAISNLDKINIPEEEIRTISQHLVHDDATNSSDIRLEKNFLVKDLQRELEYTEWRIIQLINEDLKERSDSLDIEEIVDASLLSSEERISYLQKNRSLLPLRVLNDIEFLFDIIPNFEKWAETTSRMEYINFLKNCDAIMERVNRYLFARTMGLD